MNDFRIQLRSATRAAHESVDRRFGGLDVSRRDDLRQFMSAQYYGHAGAYALAREVGLRRIIRARLTHIREDLRHLGGPNIGGRAALDWERPIALVPADLGIAYVIAGSLHGARILRRQWEKSDDTQVGRAAGFMNFTGLEPLWEDTLQQLRVAEPAQQPHIVATALHVFGLFESGIKHASLDSVHVLT